MLKAMDEKNFGEILALSVGNYVATSNKSKNKANWHVEIYK